MHNKAKIDHVSMWVVSILTLLCASCLDKASSSNDNGQSIAGASGVGAAAGSGGTATTPPVAGMSGPAGTGAAGTLAGTGGTGVAGSSAAGTGAGGAGTGAAGAGVAGSGTGGAGTGAAGAGTGGAAAAGTGGASGAGTGEAGAGTGGAGGMSGSGGAGAAAPDPSLIKGTGTSCSSYGAPMNGKCGGYFCGVDMATLAKAVDPAAKCGGGIELLCQNAVVTAVGMCARQIKAANLGATNEQIRPMVEQCVFENAEIKAKTSSACLACTITAAECAGDNCLIQCLAGDSAQCDACRKTNNCDQPVFACGGLPTPF